MSTICLSYCSDSDYEHLHKIKNTIEFSGNVAYTVNSDADNGRFNKDQYVIVFPPVEANKDNLYVNYNLGAELKIGLQKGAKIYLDAEYGYYRLHSVTDVDVHKRVNGKVRFNLITTGEYFSTIHDLIKCAQDPETNNVLSQAKNSGRLQSTATTDSPSLVLQGNSDMNLNLKPIIVKIDSTKEAGWFTAKSSGYHSIETFPTLGAAALLFNF